MNPILLVVLIVGGLILIDLLLRFARTPPSGQLESETQAVDQLCREYPELDASNVSRVVLTADRRAAFVAMTSGPAGFVSGMGDRFVVRQLRPADIREAVPEAESALRVRFNEVALRPMRFEFSDSAERDLVLVLLGAARGPIQTT